MAPIRILIVDDHPIVRGGLRALLASLPDHEVVAEAADGESALREAVLTDPDVILMDIRMPGMGGLEAARRITRAVPGAAILMLTMHDDDETVFAAMRAGARGYVLKGASQEEIDRAIRGVAAGDVIFGPGVAGLILGHFGSGPAASAPFPELTPREREVLDILAAGKGNAAIASQLSLSHKTIANHVSSILTKLAVDSRSEAIVRARDRGLGR